MGQQTEGLSRAAVHGDEVTIELNIPVGDEVIGDATMLSISYADVCSNADECGNHDVVVANLAATYGSWSLCRPCFEEAVRTVCWPESDERLLLEAAGA